MRINRILLKGYKRFRLDNIGQLEAEFPSNVTVIIGSNGSGKSSLLSELCPLPGVRTDFEVDGRKELDITHNGKSYQLISDFSNKSSPHSFIEDGVELNIGHTTDIQNELVLKYFGITSSIRDLIYNKIKLTKTTKAERRNLFLKIAPMDLSLILDTHKKTLGKIKDCKANLTLLYTKKNNLESKMMSKEVLDNNINTKNKLKSQSTALQELILGLTQHIETIKNTYKEDLLYNGSIDTYKIHQAYLQLRRNLLNYTCVARGDKYEKEKEKLNSELSKLHEKKENSLKAIEALTNEIEEFNKHLDSNENSRSANAIEKDIQEIDSALTELTVSDIEPIPENEYQIHFDYIETIKSCIDTFIDCNTKMLPIDELYEKRSKVRELRQSLDSYSISINSLKDSTIEMENELTSLKEKAHIPAECTMKCGLRSIFSLRSNKLNEKIKSAKDDLMNKENERNKLSEEYKKLIDLLTPFIKYKLVDTFNRIKNCLCNSKFNLYKDDNDLIDKINNQPVKLLADMNEIMKMSDIIHKRNNLLDKRKLLETELSAIVSSSNVSTSFIKKELDKKTIKLGKELQNKVNIDKQLEKVNDIWNKYQSYSTDLKLIKELQENYDRGERSLVVKKAIEYWTNLRNQYSKKNDDIQEELRQIETVIKEQEMLKHTYDTEIIPSIDKITKDREVLNKIEYALSPNTGIPHDTMVKYLNIMINNVNYFLSQIWSYKMQLDTVSNDDKLDYGFPLTVYHSQSKDISLLSDGQCEVIDLVWVLAILLQMNLLKNIPFYADEISRCMDTYHRGKTLAFLNSLIDSNLISQLFIINHFAAISEGFTDSNVVCLNNDNLNDLPSNTNEFVKIKYN